MEARAETKIERIILKHLTGSKSGKDERIELSQSPEILIGRHPAAHVRYDADNDDLVSGRHARITQDAADPCVFTLTDTGSRNGTYVNNQKATSPVRLLPGDVLQFGAGGPKLRFDCEPCPEELLKRTRAAVSQSAAFSASHVLKPTRANELNLSGPLPASLSGALNSSRSTNGSESAASASDEDELDKELSRSLSQSRELSPSASRRVGKSTVWAMIAEKQRETRKVAFYGVAVLAVVFAAAMWKLWPAAIAKCGAGGNCASTEIAKNWGNAAVKIYVTWKLISPSGGLVYHQYMLNRKPDSEEPYIQGGPRYIPWYVKLQDGTIEPYLTYDGNRQSVPIGGAHTGSGFVVTSQGFILTNRHVAAAWEEEYSFPDDASIGIVFAADKKTIVGTISSPPRWIPARTRQEFGEFKGANDRLEVGFPGSSLPYRAELVRHSPRHDAALIKINMPEAPPKVELFDNYDTIQEGEAVTVLGYPGVTPPVRGYVRPQESASREGQMMDIPTLTVTPGNVGAVLRGSEKEKTVSTAGDVYQLTVNATGSGNSGGPVFDDKGRVIGILFAVRRFNTAVVSYAVPIRYGKELLSR